MISCEQHSNVNRISNAKHILKSTICETELKVDGRNCILFS